MFVKNSSYLCTMQDTERHKKLRKMLKPQLMNAGIRTKISKGISKWGVYHVGVPLDELFAILKQNGVVPLQEDNTEWEGMVGSDREGKGYVIFPLANDFSAYKQNGVTFYEPIKNSSLILNWQLVHTKNDINAYLS